MFTRKLASLAVALVIGIAVTGGPARAATVTFDLSGAAGNLGSSETFNAGPIALDVTSAGGDIHQLSNGLGVTGNPGSNRLAGTETLTFAFTPRVSILSSIVWEFGSGTETFDVLDGFGNILASFGAAGAGGSSSFVTLFNMNLIGDTFVFAPTSGAGIRIKSLTVSEVPLPAAGLLLAAALGGLGVAGHRRRNRRA